MATKDDITAFNGSDAMTFHCKACKQQFASMPAAEVIRRTGDGTLQQAVDEIVDEHLRKCA